jgi:uncharacterized protein (TIGR02099 family)
VIKKITLRIWYLFAAALVLFALAQGAARLLITKIPSNRVELALSDWMAMPVSVGNIHAGWYGFTPVVEITDLSIGAKTDDTSPIVINHLSLGLNIWESIIHRKLMPGLLLLDGTRFSLSLSKRGEISFPNIDTLSDNLAFSDKNKRVAELFNWLFKQEEVQFKNVSVDLTYQNYRRVLKLASIKLVNEASEHHLKGDVSILQPENVSAHFIANLKGQQSDSLTGKFFISLSHIPLALGGHNFFIQDVRLKAGIVNAELWGEMKEGEISSIQSDWSLNSLLLFNSKTLEEKNIPSIKLKSFFENDDGKKTLKTQISFNAQDIKKPYELIAEKDKKALSFQLSKINLRTLTNWYDFLTLPYSQELLKSQLQGDISNLQFRYEDTSSKSISFDFKELGFHSKRSIGVSHLSGQLHLDSEEGKLSLDSQNAALFFPSPYGKSMTFDFISGVYRVNKIPEGWRFAGEKSFLKNTNLMIKNDFVFDWNGTLGDSNLSINANFKFNHLDELRPYIPIDGIKPKLYRWLNMALLDIPVLDGRFILNGRLGDFPYKDTKGAFHLEADSKDATLKFHSKWPEAKHIDAHIDVNKSVFNAVFHEALLDKNKVNDFQVVVSPLGDHKLNLFLQGETHVNGEDALAYVFKTPLKEHLGLLDELSFKGDIDLSIGVTIPLYPENDDNIVWGDIQFENNKIKLCKNCNMKLTELKGPLFFDQDGILDSRINALFWDNPALIELHNQDAPIEALFAKVNGHMKIDNLKKQIDLPVLHFMRGELDYHLDLMLPKHGDRQLSLTTSLASTSINLPYPLHKSIKKITPFKLAIKSNAKNNTFSFNYNDIAKGILKYAVDGDQVHFEKGGLTIGQGEAILPKRKGVAINANLKKVKVKDWDSVLTFARENQSEGSMLPYVNKVKMEIGSLLLNKGRIQKLNVEANKMEGKWQLSLISDRFKGDLSISDAKPYPIFAQFDYFHLHSNDAAHDHDSINLSYMPPIKLHIDKLDYDGIRLGKLSLESTKKNGRLSIDDMMLQSPSHILHLKSTEEIRHNKRNIRLDGYLESGDLGKSLASLNLTPVIESQKARVNFELGWPNDLFDFDLNKLNGKFRLKMDKGWITHLSPETEKELALGKLLSILSLQTLPRRLVLDFSDLSHKGFSFDTFKGDFSVNNGVLEAKKAYFDGTVAYINIMGDLNLSSQRYDLILKVSPHITASLPVVATIAGGPIAGAIVWAASKLINKSMRKVSAYTYQVTGPWEKPNIQQTNIVHS